MREKRVSCFNDTRICPETRFKEMRNSTFDTLVGDAISKLRGDFILRVSKNIKPQNSYFTLSKRNGLISRIIFNFLGIILGRDAIRHSCHHICKKASSTCDSVFSCGGSP